MSEITKILSSIIGQLRSIAGPDPECSPREEKESPDTARALSHILRNKPANAVLAFGYTHRELAEHRSAVKNFSGQIVPYLSRRGYKDLVLEIFPKGKPGSVIENEIAAFNRSGKIGKEMLRFLEVTDKDNFVRLLKQMRSRGIAVHAGGVDYETVYETLWYPNFSAHPKRFQRVKEEITRNSGEALRTLAAKGKKVFSLNGCIHNDLYPTVWNISTSFGSKLNRFFPQRVIEMDLVIPELSERNKYYRDLALSGDCNWRIFIPNSGVNVLSERGPNSYLLYWH